MPGCLIEPSDGYRRHDGVVQGSASSWGSQVYKSYSNLLKVLHFITKLLLVEDRVSTMELPKKKTRWLT